MKILLESVAFHFEKELGGKVLSRLKELKIFNKGFVDKEKF
jgi:hypothetical protein